MAIKNLDLSADDLLASTLEKEQSSKEKVPSPTPKKEKKKQSKTVRKNERLSERTENRTDIRSVVLPTKRISRRHSFEIYDDQLTKMKAIKYQADLKGEKVFLSDLVRNALDEYLKDK